ncbi:MAG: sulfite exporter TauE/SafE family protein [Acidobacteriota bacterium]|nr:sulfite exporter TauE/SafE family protein [Acidobacteriota bacterium]
MEFLLGFIIALAIALTGVGAGSMTTPLLILLLRVSPATAVGTALTFGWIVKIATVPVYAVRRQINWRVLSLLLAGGLPGVIGGGFLLNRLKDGPYQSALYATLGCLIVATALFHLYRQFRPNLRPSTHNRSRLLPWFALPIGAEVGFSSAGAGALGSLLLLSLTPLTTAEVVGTDLSFGLGVSFIGSMIQVSAGNYAGALLLKLVIGGLCGAFAGSFLVGRIPQRPLRFALLTMLIVLGSQLAMHSHAAPLPQIHAMLATRGQ